MTCPHCRGRGAITRRFLFITWQRPCAYCDGTGNAGHRREQRSWRDDDFGGRTADSYPSHTVSGGDRDEPFVAGDGGRSGGAGGGASWGEPVIVDPFAAETTSASDAAASDAAASDASWSTDDTGSSSDSGTAY